MGVRERTIFNRLQRRWFPKRYAIKKLREQEEANQRKIHAYPVDTQAYHW